MLKGAGVNPHHPPSPLLSSQLHLPLCPGYSLTYTRVRICSHQEEIVKTTITFIRHYSNSSG
jgi:hypothetical protein